MYKPPLGTHQRLLVVFAVGLALARAPWSTAQQPQPTYRTRTDLVRIDVVVVDERGVPVRGLKQADFVLLDRMEPRVVDLFEEVDKPLRPPIGGGLPLSFSRDVADNQSPRLDRLVVLIVDDMLIRPYFDKVKELAKRVVAEVGHGAVMALLKTSGTDNVEVTEDIAAVLAAIDRIGTRASEAPRVPRRFGDQVSAPTLAEIRAGDASGCHFRLLEQAARMISTAELPRKVFVYITPFCGAGLEGGAPFPDSPEGGFTEFFEGLRRAGVTVYSLDPRGRLPFNLDQFRTPNIVGPEPPPNELRIRSFNPVVLSQEGLDRLAKATGGFAVTNSDDYDRGIQRLVTDLEHYYVLGFYPEVSATRRYRNLEIRVNRSDATVRVKPGYVSGSATTRPKNRDPLEALAESAVSDPSLPLRLFVAAISSAGKSVRVLLATEVRVPRAGMRQDGNALVDTYAASVFAMNSQTTRIARRVALKRDISIPLVPWQQATTVTYQVLVMLELPAASYQFRVAAHSSASGAGGSVYVTSDLSGYANARLALGGLVLGEAKATDGIAAMSLDTAPVLPFTPLFGRTFESTDRIRIWCKVLGVDRSAMTSVKGELIDAEGQVVRYRNAPIGSLPPLGFDDTLDMTLNLDGISPGAYRLRLTAAGPGLAATRETSIVVLSRARFARTAVFHAFVSSRPRSN